jgi:hypothetical protein
MTASTKTAPKAVRKTAKEVVVFTAPQVAQFIGVEAKAFRKWLRDGEGGGYNDGTYTRYKFPDNAATAKMIQRAKAALLA